jgi:hypothetical protein
MLRPFIQTKGEIMRRGPALLSLVVPCLLIAGTAAAQVTLPNVSFEDSAVLAEGMTPGGSVIWFGVEHQTDETFSGDIYQHYRTGTAAADGTARLDLGRTLVTTSAWVVVDLASGAYAMAGPSVPQLVFTDPSEVSTLLSGGGTVPDELVDSRPYILGLAVRPGVGAWTFGGSDGGPRDLDATTDGTMTLSLDQFDALPGSPTAPASADASDLWFVVDPLKMQISVQQDGVAK